MLQVKYIPFATDDKNETDNTFFSIMFNPLILKTA